MIKCWALRAILIGSLLTKLPGTFMEGWSGWKARGLASVMLSFGCDKDFSQFPRALMQKIKAAL